MSNNSSIIHNLYYSKKMYTVEQIWTRNFVREKTFHRRRKMYDDLFKELVGEVLLELSKVENNT